MDLSSIKLTNFFSHRNTDIKLTGGLVGVFGLNGAGKSSLITDSVTWCLWGKSRVGGAGDACISTGQTFCEVTLAFRVNGNLWKVTRARIRDSKTTLEFAVWKIDRWNELTGATLKDTQQAIIRLLGMSYEIFRNSSCIEQGHANSFSSLTPVEAANVILDILQLNRYKQYRQCVTEKVVCLDSSLMSFSASIKSLEEQLESYQASNDTHKTKLQKFDVAKSQYSVAIKTLEETEVQEKTLLTELAELSEQRSKQDVKFRLTTGQLSEAEKQLKNITEKETGQCPTCKTLFTVESLVESQETFKKTISAAKIEQQRLHTEMFHIESEIADCEIKLQILKANSKRVYAKDLEKEAAVLQAEIAAFGVAAASSDSVTASLNTAREQLVMAKQNHKICSALQEAFGPKGIPLLIVDNVVKELEIAINANLKLLADLPLLISIVTQHEGSKGDMVDTFEIILNDGLEAKPYVNYSGGEKMIIDLAIRLGLSELLAKRNNFKVETLIIDEGLGSLDEANQLNFFTTLAKLETKFKHILVITHTQVKDCFKQRIELSKINGITLVDKRGNNRV